jgi:hypothetical protein
MIRQLRRYIVIIRKLKDEIFLVRDDAIKVNITTTTVMMRVRLGKVEDETVLSVFVANSVFICFSPL